MNAPFLLQLYHETAWQAILLQEVGKGTPWSRNVSSVSPITEPLLILIPNVGVSSTSALLSIQALVGMVFLPLGMLRPLVGPCLRRRSISAYQEII